MLKSVKLIVGLPGSGKTTWGTTFTELNTNTLFVDDISIVTNNAKEYLEKIPNTYEHILISDVYFCQTKVREKALETILDIFKGTKVEVIYFENSLEKCFKNVQKRTKEGDDRLVLGLIKELSKKYTIPTGENVILIND